LKATYVTDLSCHLGGQHVHVVEQVHGWYCVTLHVIQYTFTAIT